MTVPRLFGSLALAVVAANPALAQSDRLPSGADLPAPVAANEPVASSEIQAVSISSRSRPNPLIVSSPFGWRSDPLHGNARRHAGVDLPGPNRARVFATGAGQVRSAGWRGGYGQAIEIDHGAGLTTRYAHLAEIAVRPGQVVGAGMVIGRMGSTGRSTGTHLHYEVRLNGVAVDPLRIAATGGGAFEVDRVKWAAERTVEPRWAGWAGRSTELALPQSQIR